MSLPILEHCILGEGERGELLEQVACFKPHFRRRIAEEGERLVQANLIEQFVTTARVRVINILKKTKMRGRKHKSSPFHNRDHVAQHLRVEDWFKQQNVCTNDTDRCEAAGW
jgi:hypothetical protein